MIMIIKLHNFTIFSLFSYMLYLYLIYNFDNEVKIYGRLITQKNKRKNSD